MPDDNNNSMNDAPQPVATSRDMSGLVKEESDFSRDMSGHVQTEPDKSNVNISRHVDTEVDKADLLLP